MTFNLTPDLLDRAAFSFTSDQNPSLYDCVRDAIKDSLLIKDMVEHYAGDPRVMMMVLTRPDAAIMLGVLQGLNTALRALELSDQPETAELKTAREKLIATIKAEAEAKVKPKAKAKAKVKDTVESVVPTNA